VIERGKERPCAFTWNWAGKKGMLLTSLTNSLKGDNAFLVDTRHAGLPRKR